MKRLLTSKKYGGIRGSSSLSSAALFWSTMFFSLNINNPLVELFLHIRKPHSKFYTLGITFYPSNETEFVFSLFPN